MYKILGREVAGTARVRLKPSPGWQRLVSLQAQVRVKAGVSEKTRKWPIV